MGFVRCFVLCAFLTVLYVLDLCVVALEGNIMGVAEGNINLFFVFKFLK
jgi:hypothetical protein